MPLTHINDQGRARMVDVSEKAITHRIAVAAGSIYMQPETLQAIIDGQIKKGDVLAVALWLPNRHPQSSRCAIL